MRKFAMQKLIGIALIVFTAVSLTGCGASGAFKMASEISVVSREEGSGTRGAFIELLEIQEKVEGSTIDRTTEEAVIARATDVMMTNIAGNLYAIGYISLGSLNDTVKALDIEGAQATTENVKNGSYAISRPFFVAQRGELSPQAAEFLSYIMSKEGQAVIGASYISADPDAAGFSGASASGNVIVGGSSSVSPVMEKLKESYASVNPNVTVEIQTLDSTTGMNATTEGTYDIGMASRALKDTELETLTPTQIAIDGIAVIVNRSNPVSNLTKEQIKDIFTGEITTWDKVVE
jgi:phosphate transport system substrate-binding protein